MKKRWGATRGIEEAGIYQSFSGQPSYSKNVHLSWCCSNFQPIFHKVPVHFQKVSKQFPTNNKSHNTVQ